ncbi:MAG: hypothetical protein IJP49_11810 [Bacteroidales bacterium]|jgi:hypothetical protein|nr:hypothetical protein [Bacteroidales bacterium]
MKSLIWLIGEILCIIAIIDIIKKPISLVGKIISIVLLLITNVIGLVVYYLYAKDHLTEWFK